MLGNELRKFNLAQKANALRILARRGRQGAC
jgi:hypothetical protein